jgi:hypothetical protein
MTEKVKAFVTTIHMGNVVTTLWFLIGEVRVKSCKGRLYIHIPSKFADQLGTRKVVVRAIVNLEGCRADISSLGLSSGDILVFSATLTPVNGSYRITIPSKASRVLARLGDCVRLYVSIAPRINR